MAKKNPMVVKWSPDWQNYTVTDPTRIGLCTVSANRSKAMQEMRIAQRVYDVNAAAYHGDVDGDCALA